MASTFGKVSFILAKGRVGGLTYQMLMYELYVQRLAEQCGGHANVLRATHSFASLQPTKERSDALLYVYSPP